MSTQQFVCPHHLMTAFLLSRPITSDRHQFGVLYTPTVPYGEGFQEFRTSEETPIGFMCSTNCRGHRGDLNPILHPARVMCYQVTLPGPYCGHMWDSNPSETVQMSRACQLHYTAHSGRGGIRTHLLTTNTPVLKRPILRTGGVTLP